jgi:hypothetical protein
MRRSVINVIITISCVNFQRGFEKLFFVTLNLFQGPLMRRIH